ncbi:single fertilization [Trebouxia sp. C0010 RCD-2024]
MVKSTDGNEHLENGGNGVNGDFESADDPSDLGQASPTDSMDAVEDPSDVAEEQESPQAHLNGHLEQSAVRENGHSPSSGAEEGSADSAGGQHEEPREEPWKKRLYFVRMPKFPEENQYASKALQDEMDVYRSQVQLLNESMNIIRMTRDSTKESVAEARENLNAAISAFKAKQEEVEPLQKGRKDQNNMHRNVQTEFRDLEVRSEQELDGKIRDMEYHMAHESIPIAQERQMVKHIKKLRDSRPRVRQYEELYADVETARAAVHSGRGELKEMMEERQVLFEDKQLQQTIFNKHRDELRTLDDRINEIRDERSRVKEMQDGAYHHLQAIKQQSRGKKDAYYQNRRFSQEVRKMIREGKLDEARQMCEEQTSGALGQLQADPDWRKEYLELWMHQRPPPFRITFDDFDFDEIPSKAGDDQQGSSGKGKGKANRANGTGPAAAAPVMTAKEKAQAIIAASFKEVKQDLARKANAGAMNDAVPGSEAALPAPTPLLPSERRADKLPKPSKPAAKAAKPVEAPPAEFQTQEPYVPPPAQSKVESTSKDTAAAQEAAAAAAREAQVRAQQENQRRKEKAAERKQKANQKRKAREAELKAAAKAEASAQQQKSQSDTSADSDTQDSSQPKAMTSSTAATATSAVTSTAAAAAEKVPASVKEASRKVLNQAAKKSEGLKRKLETPKAKKITRKKNWQAYARQCSKSVVQCSTSAVDLGREYPAQLGLIGVVLLMTFMVFALMNRTSTSTSPRPLAS